MTSPSTTVETSGLPLLDLLGPAIEYATKVDDDLEAGATVVITIEVSRDGVTIKTDRPPMDPDRCTHRRERTRAHVGDVVCVACGTQIGVTDPTLYNSVARIPRCRLPVFRPTGVIGVRP